MVETELKRLSNESNSHEYLLLPDQTVETEWDWVFFYQSKECLETGDVKHTIVGGQLVVNRSTGHLSTSNCVHLERRIGDFL